MATSMHRTDIARHGVARPQGPRTTSPAQHVAETPQGVRRDFFAYGINFTALASAAADQAAFQIQADSDFELQKMTMFADIAAADEEEATRVLPLVTIQIQDTGNGRSLFAIPMPVSALFGDGRIPFILPTTKVFNANASVTVAVANYNAATTYNLRFVFIGSKIFKYT